ncbi:hypothetical protein [Synechococcus sp. M16CYN]|uniref:hypothetical protein n=1 Tax=Synechococcus sp. M16CYN TaxID=3103139 RepID=UPI00334127B0
MNRFPLLVWFAIMLLLLAPTAVGRVLLGLAGNLVLATLFLPLLLGGIGWLGWKVLRLQIKICPTCGSVGFKNSGLCATCGAAYNVERIGSRPSDVQTPASDIIIDVAAQDIDSSS